MSSFYAPSVGGLRAQQARLDATANNLANLSTPGYKTARVDLADLPVAPAEVARAGDGAEPPAELGEGVAIAGVTHSFQQGALIQTGNPLDLAILGDDAFFQVTTPDGQAAYTRAGAFRVEGAGHVVTAHGDLLAPPITLPEGARVTSVTADGRVLATLPGQETPQEVGQITLARFANPNGLAHIGVNRFVATDVSGAAQSGPPGAGGLPEVQSGAIEASNVDLAEQATLMIEAQRAYTMNLRAVQTLDEMIGLVIQTRS